MRYLFFLGLRSKDDTEATQKDDRQNIEVKVGTQKKKKQEIQVG